MRHPAVGNMPAYPALTMVKPLLPLPHLVPEPAGAAAACHAAVTALSRKRVKCKALDKPSQLQKVHILTALGQDLCLRSRWVFRTSSSMGAATELAYAGAAAWQARHVPSTLYMQHGHHLGVHMRAPVGASSAAACGPAQCAPGRTLPPGLPARAAHSAPQLLIWARRWPGRRRSVCAPAAAAAPAAAVPCMCKHMNVWGH